MIASGSNTQPPQVPPRAEEGRGHMICWFCRDRAACAVSTPAQDASAPTIAVALALVQARAFRHAASDRRDCRDGEMRRRHRRIDSVFSGHGIVHRYDQAAVGDSFEAGSKGHFHLFVFNRVNGALAAVASLSWRDTCSIRVSRATRRGSRLEARKSACAL